MLRAVHYRVGQFFHALTARVAEGEIEQALCILPPEAKALFRRQSAQDQCHALAVHRELCRTGRTNPHLLAAAWLHDVGKAAARLRPLQRAIIVLLSRFAPRLLIYLCRGETRWWNRAFVVHARHAELGARWAQEAGCSPLTVALIRRHQDRVSSCATEEDRLLAVLQAADSLH